jgi:hypothetical protein
MADRVFAVIPPDHYPAFQTLVPGLPMTYDAWNAKHVEKLRNAWRNGTRLTEVVIFVDAFAEFLNERGWDGSVATLEAFAVEKLVGL